MTSRLAWFAFLFLGVPSACASFGSGKDEGTSSVLSDAAASDGSSPDGAVAADARAADASVDVFVPPSCYVSDAGEPAATISVSPSAPHSADLIGFGVSSGFRWADVNFRLCLADGKVFTPHTGPEDGGPPYTWAYSTSPGALPPGRVQAYFEGATGGGGTVTPRATRDFIVAP